jgi:hypothetical protein
VERIVYVIDGKKMIYMIYGSPLMRFLETKENQGD